MFVGGAVATGYSGIAAMKGWPVGHYFKSNGVMSILGGLFGFGAIILSAFVNPWWSMILVALVGLILCRLIIAVTGIYAQITSGLLLFGSIVWIVAFFAL
jgi:hypothetical protein